MKAGEEEDGVAVADGIPGVVDAVGEGDMLQGGDLEQCAGVEVHFQDGEVEVALAARVAGGGDAEQAVVALHQLLSVALVGHDHARVHPRIVIDVVRHENLVVLGRILVQRIVDSVAEHARDGVVGESWALGQQLPERRHRVVHVEPLLELILHPAVLRCKHPVVPVSLHANGQP